MNRLPIIKVDKDTGPKVITAMYALGYKYKFESEVRAWENMTWENKSVDYIWLYDKMNWNKSIWFSPSEKDAFKKIQLYNLVLVNSLEHMKRYLIQNKANKR